MDLRRHLYELKRHDNACERFSSHHYGLLVWLSNTGAVWYLAPVKLSSTGVGAAGWDRFVPDRGRRW